MMMMFALKVLRIIYTIFLTNSSLALPFSLNLSGKSHSDKYWRALIKILIRDDYLKEESYASGFGSAVKLTSKGFSHIRKHSSSSTPLPLPLKLTSEFLDASKEETGLKTGKPSSASRTERVDILPPDVFYDDDDNDGYLNGGWEPRDLSYKNASKKSSQEINKTSQQSQQDAGMVEKLYQVNIDKIVASSFHQSLCAPGQLFLSQFLAYFHPPCFWPLFVVCMVPS